ncbi:BAR domain-containing protein [Astrocystis sublimbata]|nr:BAR domain-containing protein [Astrocystis sublimbata]
MVFTKKFDRAFQWAGEKMGHEARVTHSDDFKMLETEMALRYDGMDRLHKSMNVYVKSLSRRGETFEDKEKGLPVSYLGRTMIAHGEDFEPDSEFGNCLIGMGRANERIAGLQETYISHATSYWLEGLERSLAMMKEYQSARKKLESRRLTYEANVTKTQKAKREDFRLEDELRASKAKYEESSEDVHRRMMDIKEAEADSVRDLGSFLDSELDHYERCAEELRRVKREWAATQTQGNPSSRSSEYGSLSRRPTNRSYAENTSPTDRYNAERETTPEPPPMPVRPRYSPGRTNTAPELDRRPSVNRVSSYREAPPPPVPEISVRQSNTMPTSNVTNLRNNLRPVGRIQTNQQNLSPDGYGDDYDTATSSGSPEYDRSESPATSYGSLSRTTSNNALRPTISAASSMTGGIKKAPPPPPPSRAKKPPPPIPAKRGSIY